MDAVSKSEYALKYADRALKADRDIVMASVCSWPRSLKYAHTEMTMDKGIVIAAVSNDGTCLQHAHPDLRGDLNVVRIAVCESGRALYNASPTLRCHVELLWTAMIEAKRHRLSLRQVRILVNHLMCTNHQFRSASILFSFSMQKLPFSSWDQFERACVVGFWKRRAEGAGVHINPVCQYLTADEFLRAAMSRRQALWAEWPFRACGIF